jgi:hypothetical protein
MKHISVTSKSMPAIAQEGGLNTPKTTVFGFWPTNDFSFFPFNWLIVPLTGINKNAL